MKKIISGSAIALMMLPLGFATSCTSDDAANDLGNGASITLSVDYPSFANEETRTTLSEESGAMVGRWATGDKLLITDASGNSKGTLTLKDGAGTKRATFTGNLNNDVVNGTYNFRFTYLGSGRTASATSTTYPLNFSTPDGLASNLNQNDVFTGTAEYTVANGTSYAKNGLQFSKSLALAHFKLVFPTGVSMTNGTVTISGDNLKSSASLNLATGALTTSADGTITIANTNGDFYITMVPSENVKPVFTANVGTKTYQGTLDARTWNAGEFVCKGQNEGVEVVMTEVQTETVFVDLDLPSGTLWADRNLGANSPEEVGGMYQYGAAEPETQTHFKFSGIYDPRTYKYYDPSDPEMDAFFKGFLYDCSYLGFYASYNGIDNVSTYDWYSIQGSNYYEHDYDGVDAVTLAFGSDNYHLPNESNVAELFRYCTFTRETRNGVAGFKVSRNGKSIFIPCGGFKANLNATEITQPTSLALRMTLTWCNVDETFCIYLTNSWSQGYSVAGRLPSTGLAPLRGVYEP